MLRVAQLLALQDIKAFCCMALVCKVWHDYSLATQHIETADIQVTDTNAPSILAWLQRYGRRIQTLNISAVPYTTDIGIYILAVNGQVLKSLSLTNATVPEDAFSNGVWSLTRFQVIECELPDTFLRDITQAFFVTLETLILEDIKWSNIDMLFMEAEWFSLKEIQFVNCNEDPLLDDTLSGSFPMLATLSFESSTFPAALLYFFIVSSVHDIQCLSFTDCVLTQDGLAALSDFHDFLKDLKSMTIADMHVHADAINELVQALWWEQLTYLSFNGTNLCQTDTDADAAAGFVYVASTSYPHLITLDLTDVTGYDRESTVALFRELASGSFPVLEELIISSNDMSHPWSVNFLLDCEFPSLKVIVCERCKLQPLDIARVRAKWHGVAVNM